MNIVITFSGDIRNIYTAENSDAESLEYLYEQISNESPRGGTNMYVAVKRRSSKRFPLYRTGYAINKGAGSQKGNTTIKTDSQKYSCISGKTP